MLAQIETEQMGWLVDLLAKAKAAHKNRSEFQVWQEGFHPQAIYSDSTMIQKIDYLHANPVAAGLGGFARALAVFLGA